MTQPKIEGVGHGVPRMLYASDGSDWYAILVDSDGHVKIDVVSVALPTGAATAANQTTMITALQLIDDLRAALGSVNTDDLQVDVKTYPGSNVLGNFPFGYYDRYAEMGSELNPGVGLYVTTLITVPPGEIWIITNVSARDETTAVRIAFDTSDGANWLSFHDQTQDIIGRNITWDGQIVLKEGDGVRILFITPVAGDDLYWAARGYKMKVA